MHCLLILLTIPYVLSEGIDPEDYKQILRAINDVNHNNKKDNVPEPTLNKRAITSLPPLPTLSTSSTPAFATPIPTIPSMANNPYLAQSTLPQGTVFIAVGAILGGLGLAIIGWRMASAVAFRRSIKRSEKSGPVMSSIGGTDNQTLLYPGDPSRAMQHDGVYGPAGSMSSDNFRNQSMISSSNGPGGHNLFFSPTAEVMNTAIGNTAGTIGGSSVTSTFGGVGTRNSVYLPAGYYAPGSGNGGGGGAASITSRTTRNFSMARESMYGNIGNGQTLMGQINGGTNSIRGSTFGGVNGSRNFANESQRAPSAYLDDLLGHE